MEKCMFDTQHDIYAMNTSYVYFDVRFTKTSGRKY